MYALVLIGLLVAANLPAQIRFVTKIGGSDNESAAGIARDPAGNYYVGGTTNSFDFPATTLFTKRLDSTLYRVDGGASAIVYPPTGRALTALAADPLHPGTLYAVFGLDTFKTTDGGDHWQALNLHFTNNDYPILFAVDSKAAYAFGRNMGSLVSTDGGATWINAGPGPIPRTQFAAHLMADPFHPGSLILSTTQNAWRSNDSGASWQMLTQPLNTILFDPGRKDVVFGLNLTNLLKSADGGVTWISTPLPNETEYAGLYPIATDGSHPGTVYVSLPSGLWKTTNDAATWTLVKKFFFAPTAVAVDPNAAIVYVSGAPGVYRSTDGFTNPVGVPLAGGNLPLLLAPNPDPSQPSRLYSSNSTFSDAFVAKLDPTGKILWATLLGGSGIDSPVGIAADASGVYLAGNTSSLDFPGRAKSTPTQTSFAPYVVKISADGSRLLYSRVFETVPGEAPGTYQRPSSGIAIDSSGAAYIAITTETSRSILFGSADRAEAEIGHLPPIITGVPTVLKLSADGSTIVYATGVGQGFANGIAVNQKNEAYLLTQFAVAKLDSNGKDVTPQALPAFQALLSAASLTPVGDLLLTGSTLRYQSFQATSGAFQAIAPRAYNPLAGDFLGGDSSDAFMMRVAADLTTVLAATRLSGEASDSGTAIASDSKGNALVGGTTASFAFPTRAPTQGLYNKSTSFATKVSSDATQILFSTFAGDSRPFLVTGIAADLADNPVIVGHTQSLAVVNGLNTTVGDTDVFVAALSPIGASGPRLDAVLNSASLLGEAIAPEEILAIRGARFGATPGRVLLDGNAVEILDWQDSQILARALMTLPTQDGRIEVRVEVEVAGQLSNAITMPITAISPAIYTTNRTGIGQGLIFNQDGTLNSSDNPAAEGSIVSIVANGLGHLQHVDQSVVTATPLNVYIGSLYSSGVDANLIDVPGLPAKQFAIKVIVPKLIYPGSPGYSPGPVVAVVITAGASPYTSPITQGGVSIAVKAVE